MTGSREQSRLGNFIRRRVSNAAEADDILQGVFYEFVEAYRLLPAPIEHVSAWLFRVARNRIVDLSRKKKQQSAEARGESGEAAGDPGRDSRAWRRGHDSNVARARVHGMQVAYTPNAEACQSCGLCVAACPEQAITLRRRGDNP